MRVISSCFVLSLLSMLFAADLLSQPQVSYIIPDIGAPGMNTYVEIVAPQGATGTFGADGIYDNNPGDNLRVIAVGAASDVIVGPLVVSWNGRLISTQVFVKRTAPANQTVQLIVEQGAAQSTPLDFTIVAPTAVTSGAGGALGQGSLGQRSKRGAMIVSSLSLTGGNYTVSTNDPDNSAAGNQAYLPFILISKGPVNISSGVTISVNGNSRDGGPGGGGGGGQVCDKTALGDGGPGTNGGAGYTGGGEGGRNVSGSSTGQPQTVGVGTGASGVSLNTAVGGRGVEPSCSPQGAGGGTGHPFGHGGYGWCSGSPSGEYGGASSGGENSSGAGAGYTADGTNGTGTGTANTRGRAYGNAELVPMAGGSGGAASNPQAITGGCGGFGGGGGGAIAIYSMDKMIMQGTVSSNGAAGGSASSGQKGGGGGSGGGLIFGAKEITSVGGTTHTVAAGGGGSNGGGAGALGRARYDGFIGTPPSVGSVPLYVGPTSDTTSYVTSPNFVLTGTRGGTNNIRVYMRGDNSNWQLLGAPTYSGRNWSLNVATSGSTNYYFAAFQEVPSPNNGQYTAEPSWVTSQVAANIVQVAVAPKIDTIGEPNSNFGNPGPCPIPTDRIVVHFKSTGTATLNVRALISGAAPGVFTIIDPPGISGAAGINYPPGPDEITITVRANYVPGTQIDTLWIYTNDPRPGYSKIGPIILTIVREQAEIDVNKDTIQFGQVCVGSQKDDSVMVHFHGNVGQDNMDLIGTVRTPFFQTPTLRSPIVFLSPDPGQFFDSTIKIPFRFKPTSVGIFFDSIRVKDGCDSHTVYIKGEGVEVDLTTVPGVINYPPTALTTTTDRTVTIHNNGTNPVTIRSGKITPANSSFTIIDPSTLDGITIQPGDSVVVTIRFAPLALGSYSGRLELEPDGPCNNIPPVGLNGFGVDVCLRSSLTELFFMADSCSVNPQILDTTVTLLNCGGLDVEIENILTKNGKVAANFPAPQTLTTGKSADATITWDPAGAGTGTDSIAIAWRDVGRGVRDTIWIPVTLKFDRAIVQLQTVSGDTVPSILDIGGVYQCSPSRDTVVLVNAGTVEGEITGGFQTGGRFQVDPPLPFHLDVGESKVLVISLDPSNAPDVGTTYTDELVLRNGKCDQEWKIGVMSTRYNLTFDVANINFGGTNLNLPRTQTAQFVNTTNAPATEELVIDNVSIDPPSASPPFEIVDPSLLPAHVLADSGRFSLPVSFKPTEEKVYNGRLCFHIVAPCDTTICIDMTGEGIRSNIYVPQGNLDFGDVYYCADSLLKLTIYSVGPQPLRVDSLRITGADQAGFEIVSISKVLAVTLDPGFPTIVDSINVTVRFLPMNVPPDGPKVAALEIYSNDSAQGLLTIPLLGNRVAPTVVGPAIVNYGTVIVKGTNTIGIPLTNTSRDTIRIINPLVGAPFSVVSPIPVVIPPGETVVVDVEFKPDDSKTYNDTLVGDFTLPCNGEVRVPLTGDGLRGATVISIPPTVVGEPRQRISIPIVLEESQSIAQVGATTFQAWIRFNGTMLLPIDVQFNGATAKRAASSGSILSNVMDGTDRVVQVEVKNDPLPTAPDTLGWIDAVVLLGNSVATPITFDSLRWTDGEVATTTKDGTFTLQGYCQVGSDRLIRVEGAFGIKAVAPNPFTSEAEIEFETVENGQTSLEVYDVYGRQVAVLLDAPDLPVQAHLATWHSGDEPAGIYYAVLITPTQRSIKEMMLVK